MDPQPSNDCAQDLQRLLIPRRRDVFIGLSAAFTTAAAMTIGYFSTRPEEAAKNDDSGPNNPPAIVDKSKQNSEKAPEIRLMTAPESASHPLDPLTVKEMKVLKSVLQEQFGLTKAHFCQWAGLKEPSKEAVNGFRPGEMFTREAFAVILCPDMRQAVEVVVDLDRKVIVSKTPLGDLQPGVSDWDETRTINVVDNSSEVRAALEKRGYKLGDKKPSECLYIPVFAPGPHPEYAEVVGEHQKDPKVIRMTRVEFHDRQGGRNDYGPLLPGLYVLVDVYQEKVLKIYDAPAPAIKDKFRHDVFDPNVIEHAKASPQSAVPKAGTSIEGVTLSGNHLRWDIWDLRYSFNYREGLVLHQMGVHDGAKLRSVCYRAALSEMLVAYGDPGPDWVWREYYDEGEYGLGYCSSPVQPGKQIPSSAITVDALLPSGSLDPMPNFNDRVFIYERSRGGLLNYSQIDDGLQVYAQSKELVIGFVTTLGNYSYVFNYILRQDGSFAIDVELQGIVATKVVESIICESCTGEGVDKFVSKGDQAFGALVAPQLLAVHHQHLFCARLDMDVDGLRNAVKELNRASFPIDRHRNPLGRGLTVESTVLANETGRLDNPATDRRWVIYSTDKSSELGHFSGYEFRASGNPLSIVPDARKEEPAGFTKNHFWVTKLNPDQLFAGGRFPNQAGPRYRDGLFHYANDKGSIYKEDVVAWCVFGTTHLPSPEDYPLMPGTRVGLNVVPHGFFARSPALRHMRGDAKESKPPPQP